MLRKANVVAIFHDVVLLILKSDLPSPLHSVQDRIAQYFLKTEAKKVQVVPIWW